MECYWDKYGVILTQTTLIENLTTAHGISGTKHLLPVDLELYKEDKEFPCNQKIFQKIVGSLLYIV